MVVCATFGLRNNINEEHLSENSVKNTYSLKIFISVPVTYNATYNEISTVEHGEFDRY